ncbi:MAG: LacI family DNA-binding transcriptional regulator [Chitinophagaceae bacterium]
MLKEITIYDLAKELNLSPATVSRGLKDHRSLNKNTKKRIMDKAEELGYRSNNFASNLRKQKTHTIGVVVPQLNSNFIASVLSGIEKVTTYANYDIIITHSSESGKKEIANANNLFHKRVDGLIVSLASDTTDLSHFQQFFKREIPVVFFDRVEETSNGAKIIIDNYKAAYEATKHLIDQGCKRIAHITSNQKRNVYSKRYSGYRDALENNNIPFDEKFVFIGALDRESSLATAQQIAKMKPLPDGVFAINDLSAALCIQVFKEHGIRVPEDIAVVGFNNDTIGIISDPQLTTINYPAVQMGEQAAMALIDYLTGNTKSILTDSIILNAELIVRESSLKKRR